MDNANSPTPAPPPPEATLCANSTTPALPPPEATLCANSPTPALPPPEATLCANSSTPALPPPEATLCANSAIPAPSELFLGDSSLHHYQLTNVIKNIQLLGNAEDLYKHRQTSQFSYDFLNPTFLTIGNLTLELQPRGFVGTEQPFELMTIENELSELLLKPRTTPWTPLVAKIFRRLSLSDVRYENCNNEITALGPNMNLITLISQISPSVTTLEFLGFMQTMVLLNSLPETANLQTPVAKFSGFCTRFPNLEKIKIMYGTNWIMPEPIWTLDDLEEIIRSLISEKPKIQFSIVSSFFKVRLEDILRKFGFGQFPQNLELILFTSSFEELRQIQEVVQGQPAPCSAKLHVRLRNSRLGYGPRVKQDFETLIGFCLQFQAQIQGLVLNLGFGTMSNVNRVRTKYCEVNDAGAVRDYLTQLSPFLTELWIKYSADLRMEQQQGQLNILGIDASWTKLQSLQITNYAQPLEVLKNTPNLEILTLENVEEELSVFHKPEQSREKALEEYFGNLRKLKELWIKDVRSTLIIGHTDNQDKLKKILPKLKKLSIQLNYGNDRLFLM